MKAVVGSSSDVPTRAPGMTRAHAHEVFESSMTVSAVLVLPAILIDSAFGEEPFWAEVTNFLDWAVWLGFVVSLSGLFATTNDRRGFPRRHVLDVLLIILTPPVAPLEWQALRALRVLRLVRLLFAAIRLHRFARRLSRASVVGPAAVTLVVVVVGAAAAIRLFEPEHVPTLGQGIWWATSRATAMGDGGVTIKTLEGHVLEILVVLSGLAFLSLITAAIATVFVKSDQKARADKLDVILARLEAIEQHLDVEERS